MTRDPHTPPDLVELAAAACSGSITPDEVAQLEQLLIDSADARRDYSEHCEFDADLRLYWRSNGVLESALDCVRRASEAEGRKEEGREQKTENREQKTADRRQRRTDRRACDGRSRGW